MPILQMNYLMLENANRNQIKYNNLDTFREFAINKGLIPLILHDDFLCNFHSFNL